MRAQGNHTALTGSTWQLLQIRTADGDVLESEGKKPSTIVFQSGGHVGGRAACNHYFGSYTVKTGGRINLSRMGSTLMACLEPSLGNRLLHMLPDATRYTIDSGQLRLVTEQGETLLFERKSKPRENDLPAGVDFHALGQEPGWLLNIRTGERMHFVYDYGTHEVTLPASQPVEHPQTGRRVYRSRTGSHELTVIITDDECTDVMSGRRYPATVTVKLDGHAYQGCGRVLHPDASG